MELYLLCTGIAVLALLLAVVQPLIVYLSDPYRLRKYPSASIASLTSFWYIWQSWRHNRYLAVHQAHQKLGNFVRIQPKHVSISDPQAVKQIYGHGSPLLKSDFYNSGAGGHRHLGDVIDNGEHGRMRKLFSHVFAHKTILGMEHVVIRNVELLLDQMDKITLGEQKINIRRYLNYYTLDLISELMFGQSFGCIGRGSDIVTAERPNGTIYPVSFMTSLHSAVMMNVILGTEPSVLWLTQRIAQCLPWSRHGDDYSGIVRHQVRNRTKPSFDGEDHDIFQKLISDKKGEPMNLDEGEILAECNVMLNAGSDTTAAALTATLVNIYKNPDKLTVLRQELDPLFESGRVQNFETVSTLPYLRACIEESLRLNPPLGIGLPRVVPSTGYTISGKYFEPKTIVSVPLYTIQRDPTLFDEPDIFKPERWLSKNPEVQKRLKEGHFPFITGSRACIGRNIAYIELQLLIPAIVHRYNLLVNRDFTLPVCERFNMNPGDVIVRIEKRTTKTAL